MELRTFTLTTLDDHAETVFAVGLSIIGPDGEQEVVIYRRDPRSGQAMFATFDTPERALTRWSTLVPLRLEWAGDRAPDLGDPHAPVGATGA